MLFIKLKLSETKFLLRSTPFCSHAYITFKPYIYRERERHMTGGMIPPLISSQRQESVNRFTGGGFNLKQAQKA